MTKEQYLELKKELKKIAIKIKEEKNNSKNVHRIYNKFYLENFSIISNYWQKRLEYEQIKDEYIHLYNNACRSSSKVSLLKNNFRVLHVFLSLCRGKKYNQIEKVKHFDPLIQQGRIFDHVLNQYFEQFEVIKPTE